YAGAFPHALHLRNLSRGEHIGLRDPRHRIDRHPGAHRRPARDFDHPTEESIGVVRYLILTDIHANWEALQAVVPHDRKKHERILCCGDLVGYGADPNLVVEWVRENCSAVVRGNHDKACTGIEDLEWFNPVAKEAALWTMRTLSPENAEYTRALAKGPL